MTQDQYYRKQSDPLHHKIKEMDNFINYEIIEAMDMDLMLCDIFQILGPNFVLHKTKSSSIYLKNNNLFRDHYRSKSNCDEIVRPTIKLNILIIEGFLIFNHPVLVELFNIKFHIHVPYEISYERRNKRVYAKPDIPTYFELFVWPYYEKHMKEYENREEIISLSGAKNPDKCLDYAKNRIFSEL